MFYRTYRLLTRLIFLFSFPVFLVYALLTGRHRDGLRQRLGLYKKAAFRPKGRPQIWLHGASVGEVRAAGVLIGKIVEEFPGVTLVLSTVTEPGLRIGRQLLSEKVTCLLAPLDLPGAAARAAEAIQPDVYLCLETELWPNTLAALRNHGAACFLLNARVSEKSFRRYRRFTGFTREILAGFSGVAAITANDAERLIGLGANPKLVSVCGNVKYDLPEQPQSDGLRAEWRRILGLADNTPVLVAGSTHSGEELMLLKASRALLDTLPGLVLILAPRHLDRLASLRAELTAAGAEHDLLSQIRSGARKTSVVVVDTMGELANLYSAATYIFCGGSLVERGGHNIIEAARWGRPVFYGPSMKDFSDARELLEAGGGGFQINSVLELCDGIRHLAASPDLYERAAAGARQTAISQRGAAERQLQPVFAKIRELVEQKKLQPASNPA